MFTAHGMNGVLQQVHHETYGTEMQSYLLGAQDLSTTLQTVDEVVSELLSK